MGEKLAIVSSKVQTTRHRIKGILSTADYQIVISDTPGIIEPQYKLHERMMAAVRSALEDGDLAILLVDLKQDWQRSDQLFSSLTLKVPAIVVLNKKDLVSKEKLQEAILYFSKKAYCKKVIAITAKSQQVSNLLDELLPFLPTGNPFYDTEQISDLQTRFFVGEIIRGKIYDTMEEEIPYHTAVMVREFKEKPGLIRILADIIVNRETQKGILLGQQGATIKKIGSEARKDIEVFLQEKVYLELFVKVRPRWRDNELFLNEYGY